MHGYAPPPHPCDCATSFNGCESNGIDVDPRCGCANYDDAMDVDHAFCYVLQPQACAEAVASEWKSGTAWKYCTMLPEEEATFTLLATQAPRSCLASCLMPHASCLARGTRTARTHPTPHPARTHPTPHPTPRPPHSHHPRTHVSARNTHPLHPPTPPLPPLHRQAFASATTAWLQPGVPQSGSLLAGEARYYGVRVGEGEATSLTVALTPTEGDPDLYVSGSGRYPTRDEAQWSSSLGQGHEDLVYAPSHDPLACTGCTYRALVYAYSDSSYSLTMSLRSPAAPSLTVLQAG